MMAWYGSLRRGVSTWFSNPRPEGGATVPVSSFSASPKSEPVTSAPEISSNDQSSEHNGRAHDEPQCSQTSKYTIFLSHSGAQKPFVEQLYRDFVDENQYPFFDQASHSLKKGEEFASPILKAAKECEVAIFIVTEQFLTSKWPMLELLTCIEAQKKGNPGLKLLPVLYDGLKFKDFHEISRWDKTWEILEKSTKEKTVKITVQNCKEAVHKLRSRLGLSSETFPGSDVKLRKAIVKHTLKLLALTPDIDTEGIQGADRLCKVLSDMLQESAMHNKGVQYLGLYGMGGLGKTTMCKALYSHFWSKFSQRACIVDLGIASRKLDRQKDLMTRFTTLSKRAIRNIKDSDAAEKTLKEHLKVPVFLAVDNVQDEEASRQEARDYLKCVCCEGSIVLITSRSRDILEDVLSDPKCCKPVPTLTEEESMELFLQKAIPKMKLASFDKEQVRALRVICTRYCFFSVQEGASSAIGELVFEDDIPKTVIKSGDEENGHYHPLAIRAVASFLHDLLLKKNTKRIWDGRIMLHHSREGIFKILELGFDSLSRKAKQIFFDVALYAPPHLTDNLYDWLLAVHGGSDNGVVMAELSKLDRQSFLNFKDNRINIHELYKEFGKQYIKEHQHSEFGIYHEGADIVICRDWSIVPRVSLQSCKPVYLKNTLETWTNVVVVHLVCCEGLYSFPIGDLVNLKHLKIIHCPQLEVISWMHPNTDGREFVPEEPNRDWIQLRFVELLYNRSLRSIPDFSKCKNLQTLLLDSSLVEPENLTSCPALETLQCGHVQSPQYCPKLESARIAWKFGRDVPKFEHLPSLLTLQYCSQLDLTSWMHHRVSNDGKEFVPEEPNRDWMQLRFVELLYNRSLRSIPELLYNRSLRSIPDFSKCKNLQTLLLDSSLVEPENLTSCPALETLQCGHVQSLQYCPKLESARIAWNFGRDIPKFEHLPSLLKLEIIGPGLPNSIKRRPHAMSAQEVFLQQYPKAMEDMPSPEIGSLTKLHTLHLQQLPMGKLPARLEAWGSNLQNLNLSGSLLSQLVDFSTLSNLQKLNIAGTNVKEVRGIDRLTKIKSLDFTYCFRLQKIPDLNRLSKLEFLSLFYCTRLKAVPRVPPQFIRGDESETRLGLGFAAAIELISSHLKFEAKLSEFRLQRRGFKTSPAESALHSTEIFHRGIQCDGCRQSPLRGPRFKAKNKTFHIKYCSTCFTKRCDTRKCQEAIRLSMGGRSEYDYNLCLTCFAAFGGNAEDFMCIDKTER